MTKPEAYARLRAAQNQQRELRQNQPPVSVAEARRQFLRVQAGSDDETLNRLQDAGLVSDNAVYPVDVALCDLVEAVKKLNL